MSLENIICEKLNLRMTSSPRRFVVSWSGGADSTALLYAMKQLQPQFDFRLLALHFNFQLRGEESRADENFCREMADLWNIGLIVHRAKDFSPEMSGIQEKARALRLQMAEKILPDWEYCEAHHLDDQLETFFFRLFRGSGLDGLAGMKEWDWRGRQQIRRPLLSLKKEVLLSYLQERNLSFRQDQSNFESDYDRNFLRNQALPSLIERFPNLPTSIFRLQEQIREEKNFFDEELEKLLDEVTESKDPWRIKRSLLQKKPAALRQRFLHSFLSKKFGIILNRQQVLEWDQKICSGAGFVFNAPKGLVVRCGVTKNPSLESLEFEFSVVLR